MKSAHILIIYLIGLMASDVYSEDKDYPQIIVFQNQSHAIKFEPSHFFSKSVKEKYKIDANDYLMGEIEGKNSIAALSRLDDQWQGVLLVDDNLYELSENIHDIEGRRTPALMAIQAQGYSAIKSASKEVHANSLSQDFINFNSTSNVLLSGLEGSQNYVQKSELAEDAVPVIAMELIADAAAARNRDNVLAFMLALANHAHVLYKQQAGLNILVEGIQILDADTDPTSDETEGDILLNEVISLRQTNEIQTQESNSMLLFLTGRSLTFNGRRIGGFANGNSLCTTDSSAVMSASTRFNLVQSSVTFVHEMGHVLGSRHDGQNNSCPDLGFLMSARPFFNDPTLPTMFSNCSLSAFSNLITTQGACTVKAGFKIQAGLTGTWYNPSTSGQGFMLDVIEERGQIFVTWYTYSDQIEDNQSSFGSSQHRWFTALGDYQGNTAVIDIRSTENGQFDTSTEVSTEKVGIMGLVFKDCNNATMTYEFTDSTINGSFDIVRLTPNVFCDFNQETQ